MAPALIMLAADLNGKPMLSVIMDEEVVSEKNMNASDIVRAMAKEIQGGGGGQPFYATAGGKDVSGLNAALEIGRKIVSEKLKTTVEG